MRLRPVAKVRQSRRDEGTIPVGTRRADFCVMESKRARRCELPAQAFTDPCERTTVRPRNLEQLLGLPAAMPEVTPVERLGGGTTLGSMSCLLVALCAALFLCCAENAADPDHLLLEMEALGREWDVLADDSRAARTEGDLCRLCGQVTGWLREFDRIDRALVDDIGTREDLPAEMISRQQQASRVMRQAAVDVQRAACGR